jgi:hypothetical protein
LLNLGDEFGYGRACSVETFIILGFLVGSDDSSLDGSIASFGGTGVVLDLLAYERISLYSPGPVLTFCKVSPGRLTREHVLFDDELVKLH